MQKILTQDARMVLEIVSRFFIVGTITFVLSGTPSLGIVTGLITLILAIWMVLPIFEQNHKN